MPISNLNDIDIEQYPENLGKPGTENDINSHNYALLSRVSFPAVYIGYRNQDFGEQSGILIKKRIGVSDFLKPVYI